jgi:hypothetical protein
MVERAGVEAKLGFKARTCFAPPAASRGPTRATTPEHLQAFLGHRNIQHTVRYTELSPQRFEDFWRT